MQTLWSRAGQARRTGCRACDTAVNALGRRVTTGTRQRKATFAEIFTACYSSMFATAAVVDAIRKEDKRQDLDRQLEETRRELAELHMLRVLEETRISPKFEDEHVDLTPEQMDQLWQSLKDIYTNRPFMKEIHRPVTLRVSEFLTRLRTQHYDCPDEATMLILRRTDYERLECAIQEEEIDIRLPHREHLNQRHLFNDTRTIVHMIKQLLDRAAAHDKSSSSSPSWEEARQMVETRSHTFTFSSIDPARAKQNTAHLNRRLREVVNSQELGLKEKVGRVCFNLLVSAHPPDMHTYNTLIVAFDKHGHQFLSESLVNSFFHYRRLKPTPSTFVAILNHYKDSNNHGKFLRALACMTGLDTQTGAKIRRRHVGDMISASMGGQDKSKSRTTTTTGDWTYEMVPLHQPLIESVIHGLLHFKLYDQAANFFVSSMKAGVLLSTSTVRQVFDECIIALDWQAAVRLILGFTNCRQDTWSRMLLNCDDGVSYLVGRLHVLLDLCGLQSSSQVSKSMLANLDISIPRYRDFLEALDRLDSAAALDTHRSTRDATLDALNSSNSRLLQIESLWKEQALVRRTTQSIESKLLSSSFPPEFRASMALHIGNSAMEQTIRLSEETAKVLSHLSSMKEVQETLIECERFRTAVESTVQDTNSNHQTESEVEALNSSEKEQAGEEEQVLALTSEKASPALPEPHSMPVDRRSRELGRLKTRPRRLLSWPIVDQRPTFTSQGQWAEMG